MRVRTCRGACVFSGRRPSGRFWKGAMVRSVVQRGARRYGRVWRVLDTRNVKKMQEYLEVSFIANAVRFGRVPVQRGARTCRCHGRGCPRASSLVGADGTAVWPLACPAVAWPLCLSGRRRYGGLGRARWCGDDMVLGFCVSWGVFLSGRRRYGRYWPVACPGVS